MQATIKLGRIFGVQIGLHYSWLIIAILVAFSLAEQFRAANRDWGEGTVWATAILTAALFFIAIILHELSHSVVAKARGLPVRSITLFALGGVAEIEKDASDAKTEFLVGIVGPLASVVIGIFCLILANALGWNGIDLEAPKSPLLAMLMWLGVINIGLAIFNLIPGFPLDGGRILRAIIWAITGDAQRSTRIASLVGQLVAFGFIFIGIFRFFSGAGLGGLWLAFIGWFLLDAARASYARLAIAESLRGVQVGDVMTRECPVVSGRSNLQTLVEEHLMRTGNRCFIVGEQDRISGLITPHEIKEIPRNRWPYTTADEVMRPLDQLHTLTPESSVLTALEMMGRDDINQIPVVKDGQLQGIISRSHILQLLQTRAELQL